MSAALCWVLAVELGEVAKKPHPPTGGRSCCGGELEGATGPVSPAESAELQYGSKRATKQEQDDTRMRSSGAGTGGGAVCCFMNGLSNGT